MILYSTVMQRVAMPCLPDCQERCVWVEVWPSRPTDAEQSKSRESMRSIRSITASFQGSNQIRDAFCSATALLCQCTALLCSAARRPG